MNKLNNQNKLTNTSKVTETLYSLSMDQVALKLHAHRVAIKLLGNVPKY